MVYGAMPFDGSNFKKLRQQITEGKYFEPATPAGMIRTCTLCKKETETEVENV